MTTINKAIVIKTIALVLASSATYSFAEDATKFTVQRYAVEGNTLLPDSQVQDALKPYMGNDKDFGDVEKALEALQKVYLKRGYGSVQVLLPEQELQQGIVHFTIIEQKVSSIKVEGAKYHDEANVLKTVPSLKVGQPPNTKALALSMKVANENPSKNTSVLFKNNDENDTDVDAIVRVSDVNRSKKFVTLDNTGNRQTGHSRVGVGYQNYNMFNRDDRLSLQYTTTLQFPEQLIQQDKVKIMGAGYSFPLYERGDSIDLYAGYADVNAGSILGGTINVTSKGLVWGARYNLNFAKQNDYQQKLVLGFDYKAFRPNSDASGVNITPKATVSPISITYVANLIKPDWQLGYSLGLVKNLTLADHGQAEDLQASPWFSDDQYHKWLVSADYSRNLIKNWIFHANMMGQYTEDHLHPGEQFGLGGMDNVRGWHERVFSGDRGYKFTLEAISPDFGAKINDQVGLKSVFFLDHGWVNNQSDSRGVDSGIPLAITSVGAGLRMSAGEHFTGRLDTAIIVEGDETTNPSATYTQSRGSGDKFTHVSFGWIW